VCPGTYPEQLTIPASRDAITLTSTQSRAATIKAPSTMAEPGDIIRVDGATNLTIKGFTIAGPLPNALFCSTESRTGLFVANNGSVTVDDNRFEEIRAADPALRGCQNGIAIRVGRQASSSFGTATITNNEFATYQKGAIVVNNVHHNDDNIDLITTNGAVVRQNAAQNSTFFDGLFADSDTSGYQFIENVATGNQLLDCEDLSTAVGVPPSPTRGRATPALVGAAAALHAAERAPAAGVAGAPGRRVTTFSPSADLRGAGA